MPKLNVWRRHHVVLCNYTAANKFNKTQHFIVNKLHYLHIATLFR